MPISISQREAVQGTEVTGGNWLVEGVSKIGVVVGGKGGGIVWRLGSRTALKRCGFCA